MEISVTNLLGFLFVVFNKSVNEFNIKKFPKKPGFRKKKFITFDQRIKKLRQKHKV